jgi:hypothetical protein
MLVDSIDNRGIAKIIAKLVEEGKEKNPIQTLYHILMIPDFDTIVYESTARILAIVYSELSPKKYSKEQDNYMSLLLNVLR